MSQVPGPAFLQARISEVVRRSPRVIGLRVKAPPDFSWSAGQHVALSSAQRGAAVGYYSIASAPEALDPGSFDLAAASDSLPVGVDAEPGAAVWVSQAVGTTVLDQLERTRDVVLVGMGTGVAPLRAIVQALLKRALPEKMQLLQGARSLSELLFFDEFTERQGPRLNYFPVLSRPHPSWAGAVGHVQDHLGNPRPAARYCVCGSAAMVNDVKKILQSGGVPLSHVHAEGY